MLLQPITVQFSKSTLKPSVYTKCEGNSKTPQNGFVKKKCCFVYVFVEHYISECHHCAIILCQPFLIS